MNRKLIFTIILIPLLLISLILIITNGKRYNKYVIKSEKWNEIINNRSVDNNISISNIKFNDYNLLIDESNNKIYYSVVESSKKYNPIINYIVNDNYKLGFNSEINDNLLDSNQIEMIVYNEKSYKIYNLIVSNYPILNFIYKENNSEGKRILSELTIFDNHKDAVNRVIKSNCKLMSLDNGNKYIFSLSKESLGHNRRHNELSILGFPKSNEYILNKENENNSEFKYVMLFINNNYKGIYSLSNNGERKELKYESNR